MTNSSSEALLRVIFQIKGTLIKTTTDSKGVFKINGPDNNLIIVFTSVGYALKEVKVNNSSINVVLTGLTSTLDDVVVIGYGQVKRKDVTGAISSIKPKTEDVKNLSREKIIINQ